LADALLAATGCGTLIKNGTSRARLAEGLPETTEVLAGTAPTGPIAVPMNGAIYMADVMGGQKTGLFFDQRDNHAFAARLARGARVLDVFSHVGGFGLAALAAGAERALAVDGSGPALALAGDGAKAMGMDSRLTTRHGDAFATLEALARRYPSARFVGAKSGESLARHFAASDVFVFPSRTDTFGLVMLEALACGVPVAAYPVAGPLDVIGAAPVGRLDVDLGRAARAALGIPAAECRAFALARSWETCAGQFLAALALPAAHGSVAHGP
jgi:hypothetical protein